MPHRPTAGPRGSGSRQSTPGASPQGTPSNPLQARPGLVGLRISATESTGLDWRMVDETWAAAGETHAISAAWMSDHLSDASLERNGPAFESLTLAAALARHMAGKWVGIAVVSNTFRHPAVLAKSATVLDNATGGRFILGLGAGWHAGEHDAFGIPLPPMRERFDRYESALGVLSALFSDAARHRPGVTLDDRFYPLRGATNEPPPVRPGGPPIWLGVTGPRGMALAARFASGWPMPGNRPGDVAYFAAKRDELARALEAAGRDVSAFTFAAQLSCGTKPAERRVALETSRAFVRAGANHVILGMPATIAPDGLVAVVDEVAGPLLGD
jgi:alkanesulfonate monooxygenase SsuD/methylene tetrahydromethanopterin reductase-like flavin-dependent oxidoreductase (luciferase family)